MEQVSQQNIISLDIDNLRWFYENKLLSKSQVCLLALWLTFGTFEVVLNKYQISTFLNDWGFTHSDLLTAVSRLESKGVATLDHECSLFRLIEVIKADDEQTGCFD